MSDPDSISGISQQGQDQQSVAQKNKRDGDDDDEGDRNERKVRQKGDDEQEPKEDEEARKAPTVSEKYNSDDADVSIISSDNVLFKVHSYRLMAASPVFRSMLSLAKSARQQSPIAFSDEVLEQSTVLDTMLDIIYTMRVNILKYEQLHTVLCLAEKWEFEHVPTLINVELQRRGLECQTYWFQMFELSMRLKDPLLIASWVREHHDISWADPNPKGTMPWKTPRNYEEPIEGLKDQAQIGGARIFEVGGWAYLDFLRMPPTVVWALLRATHIGTTKKAKIDYDKVAKELERLLTLAYKPKSPMEEEEKRGEGAGGG